MTDEVLITIALVTAWVALLVIGGATHWLWRKWRDR